MGVIALLQGDHPAAQDAFRSAISQADALLALTSQYYAALNSKALAFCGLTLCGVGDHRAIAAETFRASRSINRGPGVVARVLRLFDGLADADPAGLLAGIRAVAAGNAS